MPIILDPTLKKSVKPVSQSFCFSKLVLELDARSFVTASLFENYTKGKKGLCHTSFLDCINYSAFSRRTKREKKEANTISSLTHTRAHLKKMESKSDKCHNFADPE